MNIRLAAFLMLSCFVVPAFAAKPVLPATPIRTSQPTEILLTQQELAVDVPNAASAAGMQFGLIGALVGTAINNAQVKNAEQRVGELRNALLDYPFNARVEAALREKLSANDVLGGQGLQVLHATWDADTAQQAGTTEDALVLAPRYAILSNFEQLTVSLTLSHMQRTARAGKKPRQKALFSRTYAFNFPLSKISGSGAEEDAARWVGFGRVPMETLLDTGIDQVTDMLVYDLSTEGRAEAELPIKGLNGTVGGQQFAGRVVRSGDHWLWLRTGPGALRVLVGQYPVSESIVASLPLPVPVPAMAAAGDATATATERGAAAETGALDQAGAVETSAPAAPIEAPVDPAAPAAPEAAPAEPADRQPA